ncbi:MAG: hypothetical protein AMXMBFR57_32830 [Acidimicrobiia bacterium]
MRTPIPKAVWITTVYLLVGALLSAHESAALAVVVMALFWPGLVLWMVWRVLTETSVSTRSLRDDEEWAYLDYAPDVKAADAGWVSGYPVVTRHGTRSPNPSC